MNQKKDNFWASPLAQSFVKTDEVKLPEMLFGYFIGPFGALLSSGIFTSMLQQYFTDVLKLNLSFLTGLQLVSTILIVAANLVVGQLIERTRVLAGKARPWILLSALTMSIGSVLMFIVPFQGAARMVWIAIAYNLYYAVAYPIYNTANATLIPVSTRDSKKRSSLASLTNVAGLGVMGAGSMVFPILVSFALKENQHLWFVAMLAVAIFTALTAFLQFKFTRERVTEEGMGSGSASESQTRETASLKQQLKAVTSEKWWWITILFYLCFHWAGAMKNSSMALVGVIGGLIAGFSGSNIVGIAIGVAVKCLGSAPACYLILAMLADVIDHIEYTSGIRTDGLTMSIYSSLMVAATPICNAILSAILGAAGYDQTAVVGEIAQPAGVQAAISTSYIWVETIGFAHQSAQAVTLHGVLEERFGSPNQYLGIGHC